MDIILSGASGQMGQAISRLAAKREDTIIVAGLDRVSGNAGYPVFDKLSSCTIKADGVIDFSHPSLLGDVLTYCVTNKLPLVIGTTGLKTENFEMINDAAKVIPVLVSSNMSTGVRFLHKLVAFAAKELYGKYDIEIIEGHHNQKVDAPSGTATALFNTVKSVVPEVEAVYDRHTIHNKRAKNEVGMHSIRGGGIVGDHDIIFISPQDRITISHNAFSKDIFAAGALDAVVFLKDKKAGYYTMENL